MNPKAKQRPKKLQRISLFKKSVWKLCSEYIRRRDNGKCYTCGKQDNWKYMDAGHYRHGNTKMTYFLEDNIHCQCTGCNRFHHGNLDIYTLKLVDQYGRKRVDELIALSLKEHYFTRDELSRWKEHYKGRLEELNNIYNKI